ncbi:MAG: hypothetical protein DRN16_00325 [Thermoplasmata archaeon]|nr:MAG: hypothetical protein DRN16_00325 [Thermoplasmata archaeon]
MYLRKNFLARKNMEKIKSFTLPYHKSLRITYRQIINQIKKLLADKEFRKHEKSLRISQKKQCQKHNKEYRRKKNICMFSRKKLAGF